MPTMYAKASSAKLMLYPPGARATPSPHHMFCFDLHGALQRYALIGNARQRRAQRRALERAGRCWSGNFMGGFS